MTTTSRRRFLAAVSAAASATTAGLVSLSPTAPLFLSEAAAAAQEKTGEKVLVVVQLSGGNDGLNTVVPFRDELYRKSRPSLAQNASAVLKIDAEMGLHPNLKGLTKLLEQQQLAILQGVGYPNPNRSHFESMDIWHTARTDLQDRSAGWLGRCLDADKERFQPAPFPAVLHLGPEAQPLAVTSRDVPSPSIRSLQQFRLEPSGDASRRAEIEKASALPRSSENDLLKFIATRTTSALEVSRRLEAADQSYKTSVNYPGGGLAQRLRQIAQLIDAGLSTRVYYVALDGFDTHSDQAAAHAALLDQLGGALAAFAEDLQTHGHLDRVATLVFSEFGRRVKENSSRGTDHGAAAPVFVVGSQVQSGLLGKQPNLADLDDGDVKFHIDFRSIYATLLNDWLEWPVEASLGAKFEPYPLFRSMKA
jgi:uncharacterized protein (DUF1501 family)